jgi:hypothetical protein
MTQALPYDPALAAQLEAEKARRPSLFTSSAEELRAVLGDLEAALAEAGEKPGTAGIVTRTIRRVIAERNEARDILGRLVETLPRCSYCENPATRAFRRGGERYCDEHRHNPATGNAAPDYPRAATLREALALLAKARETERPVPPTSAATATEGRRGAATP